MNKIRYILKNFFVPGFLDSLLIPGTLNKLMNRDVYKNKFNPIVDELISWDLVTQPATCLHIIKS